MLEGIDALVALASFGTVSEAATRLRLTQSAVSKRIQALQSEVGARLVEPDGRRLRLTAWAVEFLEQAQPLVAELRGLGRPAPSEAVAHFSLALADSIASSWGPQVVSRAVRTLPSVRVDLHSHRSVLVIESVRLGRYDLGLCTEASAAGDLVHHPLIEEPLLLVHSRLGRKADRKRPLIAIEPTSATWKAVSPRLRALHPALLAGEILFVESFSAVAQMVKAGFGNGLVPLGLARALGLPRSACRRLSGVTRRVSLVTRKTVLKDARFVALRQRLETATAAHFRSSARPAR
jgi:DNA-binding transcriptional LysR family regulator